MESMTDICRHYGFSEEDEKNLKELANFLLPVSDQLADDFYHYLLEDPYTADFFMEEEAINSRKETIKSWFNDLLTSNYDNTYLMRLKKIGTVHVRIGLSGHYVNAAMNFIRNYCMREIFSRFPAADRQEELAGTLNKVLDINLDVMTSSYREAELKKVFLSHKVESGLVRLADRLMHGLNLILMVGLVTMAIGVTAMLAYDIFFAFSDNLEVGIVKALGSLLILWMMIELLNTQVKHLRGGKFGILVFVELALVAFIRKVFVASIGKMDPMTFGLLVAGLVAMGLIFWVISRSENYRRS
jgi:uncharacterized membrane protein (DUF373 family)